MTTKVEIKLNDSKVFVVDVEDYNPSQIADCLNDNQKQMLAIGDVIVQRFSVVHISPHIEIVTDVA